jgi:AcrR family transcriptional regulator
VLSKKDRRIDRTLNLLRDALIALILEHGYDSISVLDIADKANVGRATFYLHYRNKDELLLECVESIVAAFLEQMQGQDVEEWIISDKAPIHMVFQFAARNADLFRIILRGHGSLRTSRRLQEIVAEKTSQVVQASAKKNGVQLNLPVEVISNFFAGSLLALINWWLEEDRPYSAEQMADMFRTLVMFNRDNLLRFSFLAEGKFTEK